mmetsp:Transcript_22653/g.46719  ORF Transcript_22653/g.46719 Transcript_22653/m.46719 type:complete len:108 (-) Transcript_22653:94-417(-)
MLGIFFYFALYSSRERGWDRKRKRGGRVRFQSRRIRSTVSIKIISNILRCHGRALFGDVTAKTSIGNIFFRELFPVLGGWIDSTSPLDITVWHLRVWGQISPIFEDS